MKRALVVFAVCAVTTTAFGQTPLKPSQVRPNVPGPAAKRSPGPMLDPANTKPAPEGRVATKKPGVPEQAGLPTKKGAAPTNAAEPAKDDEPAPDVTTDPRLDAARARIAARTPAAAAEIRARRADMVGKALQSSEIPAEVKTALERHVKRMAMLDRIESLAVAQSRPEVVDRVEAARQEERVRLSVWLFAFGDSQRGAAR